MFRQMYTDDAGQVVIYWLTLLASCFYTFSVQFGVIIIPLYYSGELYPGMKDEHLFKYLWVSVCLSVRNAMLFYSKDGSSTSSKQAVPLAPRMPGNKYDQSGKHDFKSQVTWPPQGRFT